VIVSLAELKTLLGIGGTAQDARLNLLIPIAEQVVKDFCRREFELQSYTEFYSGNGSKFLVLRQFPVTSVEHVWEDADGMYGQNPDSAFGPETELVAGHDYSLRLDSNPAGFSGSGTLVRDNGPWPDRYLTRFAGFLTTDRSAEFGSIKVQYTAGYAAVPQPLKLAVCNLVAIFRDQVNQPGPLVEEQLGRWRKKYSAGVVGSSGVSGQYLLPPHVQAILAPYRDTNF
jgi:hypothetical protein